MVKAKICGNKTKKDIKKVAQADAAGFIVATPRSVRNIDPETAGRLIKEVPPFISTVLVTTKKSPQTLQKLTEKVKPDYLQLHSELSPERITEIAELIPELTGLIALLSVKRDRGELNRKARELANLLIDAVLLDSKVDGRAGGTGRIHDWEVSRDIRDALHPFPVILAGGLNPGNVREAIKKVRPYGVDVATGVEENGKKSEIRVKRFLQEVNKCET
ncbi:phosphoribosylanthranilate isomerase [Candidatus Bipolaricaulota bacterium]|nr:phosphoribosylanthranilate isomerase [Candidatus Bipolaricaulota bacterium]